MPKLCCMEQGRGSRKEALQPSTSPPTTRTKVGRSLWPARRCLIGEVELSLRSLFLVLTGAENWSSMHGSSFKRKQFTLGFTVSEGISTDKRKIGAVQNWPSPQMFIDVWSFVQRICGVFQIPKQLHKMSKKLVWGHFESGKRKRCFQTPFL